MKYSHTVQNVHILSCKIQLQLWHELCDLISQNPDKVTSLNVGAIIRGGLTRFTDQLGKLWCSLADYYIRSGHFEKVKLQKTLYTLTLLMHKLTPFSCFFQGSRCIRGGHPNRSHCERLHPGFRQLCAVWGEHDRSQDGDHVWAGTRWRWWEIFPWKTL